MRDEAIFFASIGKIFFEPIALTILCCVEVLSRHVSCQGLPLMLSYYKYLIIGIIHSLDEAGIQFIFFGLLSNTARPKMV